MIKKYNILVNENDDHSDIDPYNEEKWGADDVELTMDDFKVTGRAVETHWNFDIDIKGHHLQYELIYDDDGYSSCKLLFAMDVPPEYDEFLENNYEEIKKELIKNR